jgi:uncharacterized protein (TIGR03118 family)
MRRAIRDLQQPFRRFWGKRRSRERRPTLEGLEERALLSTAPHLSAHAHSDARNAKKVASGYQQTNLVSDLSSESPQVVDSHLINPWGMAYSATGPFWISDEGSGVTTVYSVSSSDAVSGPLLTVTIPSAGISAGHPTGQVFNTTSDFLLSNGKKASFIFSTLGGTIAAWNGGATAETVASDSGAVFTGLAAGSSNGQNYLYAANDAARPGIVVYNSSFTPVTLAGTFTDPKLSKGFGKNFVPYNIQNIGGELFVTYQGSNSKGGAVAEFNTDGTFVRQITGNNGRGPLQAPWGVAQAPSGFGKFSNDLLVGNFGNGRIDAVKGKSLKPLTNSHGKPIAISGLWTLGFGNGGSAGPTNTLFFTAGINGQSDGLFGSLQPISPAT